MRNKTKWLLLSVLILLLVLFGLHRFYIHIHEDIWKAERTAVQQAKQEAGITDATREWKSVWDEVCWVVEGKNEAGRDAMVWLRDGKEAEVRLVSEGVTESQVRAIIKQKFPGIKVVRLVPGIYNEQLVWQLFYKEKSHYYYRFFEFSTGDPLTEVFTLPNR